MSTPAIPANAMAARIRPFYARVTVLGLLIAAAAAVVALAASLLMGDTGSVLFILPFVILPALIAGLVWRFGTWALVLAAVIALLSLALIGPTVSFAVSHPESFGDFVIGLVLPVGMLIALVGALVALVQRARGRARSAPNRVERTVLTAVLVLLGAAVVFSAVQTVAGRTSVPAEAKAGAMAVTAKEFKFSTDRIEARPGQPLRIAVANADPTLHTFTIRELGVDVAIAPGSERLVSLASVPAGAYTYYCAVAGHDNMRGTLVVQ
jgi:heme/copper-type cytochrome/quinol oxidase subunit 2